MPQTSLEGWVKVKKEPVVAYRFLRDLPEGLMLPDGREFPPVKRGDLVSANVLPARMWRVLLQRGVVRAVSPSI